MSPECKYAVKIVRRCIEGLGGWRGAVLEVGILGENPYITLCLALGKKRELSTFLNFYKLK